MTKGKCLFLSHCPGNEGSGFALAGDLMKENFLWIRNGSTAVAQLEVVPEAPRPSGIFVTL